MASKLQIGDLVW